MRRKNMSSRTASRFMVLGVVVGLLVLSVGYAAFSSTLNVTASAGVNPSSSNFKVEFSSSASSTATSKITPTVSGGATGTQATITNGTSPTISGLSATFNGTGQSVTYTFYARNTGQYLAYLNQVNYLNVTGQSSNKVCTPGSGTTTSMVNSACANISVSVKAGSTTFNSSNTSISSHTIAKGGNETIVVTISYTGSAIADGDFTVKFGDISLVYGSAD